jgi:spore coat polysaccharide biosynthesis predicted glycosyltransferase SpsG
LTLDAGNNQLTRSLHVSIKGNKYGIGHASRQKNLSRYASRLGWVCEELIFNQSESIELTFSKIVSFLDEIDVLILDLDPRYIELHRTSILNMLNLFKLNDCKLILFDIDLDSSVNTMLANFNFDLVFCPYVSLGVQRHGKNYSGFGLSIFSPDLERVRNRRQQEKLEFSDVLISCGGSDPFGISMIYLEVLNKTLPPKSSIKVIVGEEFATTLVEDILQCSNSSQLDIQIIKSPNSICEYFAASRFILTTGGLTRTESIYAGVPALVVDIDLGQFKSTKLFAELGAVRSLGLINPVDSSSIEANLRNFIAEIETNSEILPAMSESARLAIANNAAYFILKEIENNA